MAANHLEQLVAEWYELEGYFVRRNVLVGRRPNGGYDCELDVVGFHPVRKHLVHIEPSMDALPWAKREHRYKKKFAAGRQHIPQIFDGLAVPDEIEQIALLGYASAKTYQAIGGGRVLLVRDFLREILAKLRDRRLASQAVPEHMPILRTLQFVSEYREAIWPASGARDA